METISLYNKIKNSLPETDWGSVVRALKNDPIIWASIQQPTFLEKLETARLMQKEDWTPGNLGLILLNFKLTAKDLQNSNAPVLEDDIFSRAMNLLEGIRLDHGIRNLEEAILIALALREKHCLGDSWYEIRKDVIGTKLDRWQSALVCLFSLTSDPSIYLQDCISFSNPAGNFSQVSNILLSNPIDEDQQSSILARFVVGEASTNPLPIINSLQLIHQLSLLNPTLARKLSKEITDCSNPASDDEYYENNVIVKNLNDLEVQLLNAESYNLINNLELAYQHQVKACNSLVNLFIELTSRTHEARFLDLQQPDLAEQNENIVSKQLLSLFFNQENLVNHPLHRANALTGLLKNQEYKEAAKLLLEQDNSIPKGFIEYFVLAKNAFILGDIEQATINAQNSLSNLSSNEAIFINALTNHTESIILPFLDLLIDLDLLEEAITTTKKSIYYRRSDNELHIKLGMAYLADYKPEEAASSFYDAVMLKPDDINLRRQLAKCLEDMGEWEEAYAERKHILEVIHKMDSSLEITDLHKLTECAIQLGYLDEAVQLCQQSINLESENGYSYSLIGNAYFHRGEFESAFEQFEKGIQLSPQIPETWLALADAQYRAKNTQGSIEILQAASQAIPTSGQIHLALGEMQLSQNALTEALSTFEHGTEIEPNNSQLIFKLGTTLQRLGHLDQARQVLEDAHRRKPNQVDVAYAYAKVLLQLGEKKSAIPLLDIFIKSNPKSSEPYLEYAEAALFQNSASNEKDSFDRVIQILHKALEFEPKSPVGHALLGEALALRKEFITAKQAYQVALESNLVEDEEWFARLSLGMGRVALALGQEDVALASLQEALQADPDNSQIHKALSEVYQAVNLPDNALQSARAALNLAIDDIDTLAWYADQMLLLSEMGTDNNATATPNELVKQFKSESLNALHQAVQLAPKRTDLYVKLGEMQFVLGDKTAGISTLNSLIDNPYAQVRDLSAAGKILSDSGEICGAISCLEQAISKDPDKTSQATSDLFIDLARLHQRDGDPESAILVLNQAIESNSTYAPVFDAKADLLLSLRRDDDALSCVLEGLEKTSGKQNQIRLRLIAAKVYRRRGELKTALNYAQESLNLYNADVTNIEENNAIVIEIVRLTAELFNSILRPNRGRLLLKEMERKFKIDITQDFDYCCTYIELFFDTLGGDEVNSLISQMVEHNPNHPRILALQARIFNRRGFYQTALQTLHAALEFANLKTWNSELIKKETPSTPISVWYSLCDSALDLYQWNTALYLAHQALEQAPSEPRSHFNIARTLVLRAEYQWLCENTNVVTNSPGLDAISIESRVNFEKAISEAIRYLPNLDINSSEEELSSEISRINPIISRWRARGMAIFGNDEEIKQAVNDLIKLNDQKDGNKLQLNTDDIAALIGADLRTTSVDDGDKLNKLIQMSRAYLQDALLPLYTAIALSETRPEEAIYLLNQLDEASHSDESPLLAIRKAIFARVLSGLHEYDDAKSAIDIALSIMPNEPHWHNLAATIYQNLGNIPEAVHHTDEAIRLEPDNIENLLRLGKILIETADVDPTHHKRAIQVLERACRLEPENADPWYYLSHAYLSIMDLQQAISCADVALSLAPENVDVLTLRGEISLHQNKPQIALDYANQALQYREHEIQAVLIKSQALKDLGFADQALEVLKNAMEYLDDPLTIQIEHAILLKDVRGPKASIDALEQLVERNPNNPKILSLLAKNMAELGDTESAIQTAQHALQESNGSLQITKKADLHYLLGSLLIQARQLDQAVFHLSESIALTPNYIEPYLELGHAQQERRQFRQALEAYQKATRIAPNDPRPHYQAGIALKEGKDYQASESMLRRAADLAPDDVNIRRQLAAVVALNLVHNPRSKRITEE